MNHKWVEKCTPPCGPLVTQFAPPTGWLGPFITSIDPNTGPAEGGTTVTITGRNFSGATTVRFGSNNAASCRYAGVLTPLILYIGL